MMKTDWSELLKQRKKNWNVLSDLSLDYATCAVAGYPIDYDGDVPEDQILFDLSIEFHQKIKNRDAIAALQIIQKIELRVAELTKN